MYFERNLNVFNRGGSGLSPTRARARPSRFFDVFRVPEPEVFESGLGPTWPEPERKARGYPRGREDHIFTKPIFATGINPQ